MTNPQQPFQQPGQPQQPGGYYPPQPYQQPMPPAPKQRKKWPWIVGGVVAVLIVVGAVSGGGDKKKDDEKTAATTPAASQPVVPAADDTTATTSTAKKAAATVVYEVTSDSGSATSITYFGENGNQSQETGAALPWKSKPFDKAKTTLKTVTAQNGGGGTITCKIIVDGKVQVENSSSGQYAVVSCNGKLY
ncbi:MAG: MmpS family transport accessory protein [Gordonia sp. (in: high G+C Gram-positive bacteria)]